MFATFLCALAVSADPVAPITVDQAVVDKGPIKAGPTLRHFFVLKNSPAAGVVTISHVEVGCGCVSSVVSKQTLASGEECKLALDINTLAQAAGRQSWFAIVHTTHERDGQKSLHQTRLTISATLQREISVTPPMVAFSTTGEAEQTIAIQDLRAVKSLAVTAVDVTSPYLAVEGNATGEIKVSLKPNTPADGQRKNEFVVVRTNDPAHPEFRIPVSYVKTTNDPIVMSPKSLSLAGKTSGVVQIRDKTGQLLQIQTAVASVNGLTLNYHPGANPVTALKVTVDPAVAGPTGTATVTVTFANGTERLIPVTWK